MFSIYLQMIEVLPEKWNCQRDQSQWLQLWWPLNAKSALPSVGTAFLMKIHPVLFVTNAKRDLHSITELVSVT
jgi:hypothetical protein